MLFVEKCQIDYLLTGKQDLLQKMAKTQLDYDDLTHKQGKLSVSYSSGNLVSSLYQTQINLSFLFAFPFGDAQVVIGKISMTELSSKKERQITQGDLATIIQPILTKAEQVVTNQTAEALGYPVICRFPLTNLHYCQ